MGFYALLINVNVKEVMVTSIPPGNYKNLVLRCFQAFLMFPIMMYGIKYMPLVQVALALNLSPLFTATLSYLILKEKLKPIDIIVLVVSFIGVIILITGANYSSTTETNANQDPQSISISLAMLIFFAIPLLSATNSINQRSMRELNDFTVGAYTNIALLTVFTPYIFIQGIGLDIMSKFEYYDYIQFMIMGFTSVSINISRRTAIRYEEPGKLSGINFFQSIIQLFIDVLFFGTLFIMQQVIGIIIIFAVNFVKMGLWIQRLRHDRQTKNKLLKKLDSES
eukprot:403369499